MYVHYLDVSPVHWWEKVWELRIFPDPLTLIFRDCNECCWMIPGTVKE